MREAFSQNLVQAALDDSRVVLLTGEQDSTLFEELRRVCPDQCINTGGAVQNVVGVAAGLAKAGFRPFVHGLSALVPMRVLEQIKLDVCYEQLPIVFVGDGAGVVHGQLGASRQCTEDIAALRALPHIAILSPADVGEMTACMALAAQDSGPVYLRIGKSDLGPVHASPPAVDWGRLCSLRTGSGPLAWIATGSMVATALAAARNWPESPVWSVPCIKPLDADEVAAVCQRHAAVVVLEEHSIYGGLGSAVAEIAGSHAPTRICRIGINDRFSERCGSYAYLMREHGLDLASVVDQVAEFVAAAHELRDLMRPYRAHRAAA